MTIVTIARALHIAGGALALVTFWLPWAVGKGSPLHRRAGWTYVIAMAVVALTGIVVCAHRLADGNPRNDAGAAFLLLIGLLAAASSSYGVRALRSRGRTGAHRNAWDLGVSLALLASALAVGALGVATGRVLFVLFAALGTLTAIAQLRFWRRAPASRMAWWYAHMGGMGVACISTVTAFVVVNARLLGVPNGSLLVWTTPGVVGGVVLALWTRYYRRRFERAAA